VNEATNLSKASGGRVGFLAKRIELNGEEQMGHALEREATTAEGRRQYTEAII